MTGTIVMPKLGLTMTEGLIASWSVKPGDEVREGDILFVVETEKIATEVAAHGAGRIISITAGEGDVVPVGATVATWTGASAPAAEEAPTEEEEPGPEAGPTSAVAPSPAAPEAHAPPMHATPQPAAGGRLLATPLARKIARNAGIDLAAVTGTGPRGRIKAGDVDAFMAAARAQPLARPAAPLATAPSLPPPAGATRRPATGIEKVVARRLTEAKQTIPHFYVLAEADVTRLLALREELNGQQGFARLSLTHFVVAAVGRALAQMPEVNVVWGDDEVIALPHGDVGVAVDTARGLLVPVVRRADSLSLDAIARTMGDAVDRAREGRLEATDLQGGAISVSNVGMFGASHLVPIINPGQSAILGAAAVKPAFRPDGAGAPALVRELGLVLSCDHRVLDGVKAARFLDLVVTLLQQPLTLLRA